MAESGGTSSEKELIYDSSQSDFVFDFFCELCIDDGKQVEAEGFCVDCGEYLCGTCYNGHRMSRPTRYHVLLDKENMPKDTPLAIDRISNDISTKCKCKSGEVVKFYCISHSFLGCTTCFATVHKSCVETESILEKSETILDSQYYKDFITTLKDLQTKARDITSRSIENQALAERCCAQTAIAVKKFKEEIIEILNEIEYNCNTNAEEMMREDYNIMEKIIKDSHALLQKIQGILADFDELQASRRVCQLYIQLKETTTQVTTIQDTLKKADENNCVRDYTFEPNVELKSYIRVQGIFGKNRFIERNRNSQGYTVKTTATSSLDIDVSSNDDISTNYRITGSAVLPNNRFVAVDRSYNYKVGLFDTNTAKHISTLKVTAFPWNVAMVGENQIAVTLFETDKIVLVNVGDKLTIDRDIVVEKGCHGVAYSRGKLFVTFVEKPRLEILDLRGNVLRKIENGDDGNKLFTKPHYVCVSEDGTHVYVSDRHRVIRLTVDGRVASIYEDRELKGSSGVCTDEYGNVYVCGELSNNVHMITADCKKIKVILKKDDGLRYGPRSVSYCRKTHTLFVGMATRKVKLFVLSS